MKSSTIHLTEKMEMPELICQCVSMKTFYLNHHSDQLSSFSRVYHSDWWALTSALQSCPITAHTEMKDWRGLDQDYDDIRHHLATWCGSPVFQWHNPGSCILHFQGLVRNTIPSAGKTGQAIQPRTPW